MSARQVRRAREREVERNTKRKQRLSGRSRAAIAAGAGLGATVLFAPAAQAQETFVVTKLADTNDGVCDADCSLREAVDEANATPGADQVTFASGLSGTITLDTAYGVIDVSEAVTIAGPGAGVITVNGDDNEQILDIDPSVNGAAFDPVTISGLTFTEGYASSVNGGAIVATDASLTVTDSVFRDNLAGNGSGGDGGALGSYDSNVVIERSAFDGNVAEGAGGALYLGGTEGAGGVEIAIRDSVIANNVAEDGFGGGLYLGSANGDVVIARSTFAGNEATYGGGGADIGAVQGDILIEDSTFSGNQATETGGGINFEYLYDDEQATIRNSTITGNSANAGGGVFLYEETDDGGGDTPNGPVAVSSTIVANNSGAVGPDLGQGAFTDGFNVAFSLIENPADATINATGPNLTGVDPQLGPLADNGGPTQTHAPAFTSPVLDMGIGNGLATDQRGAPRTFDAANVANAAGGDGTDIGSVELLPGGGLALPECKGSPATVLFAPGAAIAGTDSDDVIVGTTGADQITTARGKDLVCAGDGADNVNSGGGKDRVFGENGEDVLNGKGGADRLTGGRGGDKIKGGGGGDRLSGQQGKDTLKGGAGKDSLAGGPGRDRLRGGPGKDKLTGGGGKDSEQQ